MKKVVILKIEDYKLETLKKKIEGVLYKHFPLENFFSPGDKILLKPNLLMAASPQEVITTHPVFIEAVGRIFKDANFPVFIADSPQGFTSKKDIDNVYESTGIREITQECGFKLLYPTHSVIQDNLPLCWWAVGGETGSSFKIVNLPKLKTHAIMVLTLAVKNLYGCISGLHKSYLHSLHPQTDDFAKVILKLYKNIKPSLNIIDGIIGLEGEGPAKKGKIRKMNLVAIGDDALYTDCAVSRLVGLSDRLNPLIKAAKEEDIFKEGNLELISEVEEIKNFKFSPSFIANRLPRVVLPLISLLLKLRPKINEKKCTGCAVCKEICPTKAITVKDEKASIDYGRCITCMCCQEVCRFGAVDLDKSLFLKIFHKLQRCIQ